MGKHLYATRSFNNTIWPLGKKWRHSRETFKSLLRLDEVVQIQTQLGPHLHRERGRLIEPVAVPRVVCCAQLQYHEWPPGETCLTCRQVTCHVLRLQTFLIRMKLGLKLTSCFLTSQRPTPVAVTTTWRRLEQD